MLPSLKVGSASWRKCCCMCKDICAVSYTWKLLLEIWNSLCSCIVQQLGLSAYIISKIDRNVPCACPNVVRCKKIHFVRLCLYLITDWLVTWYCMWHWLRKKNKTVTTFNLFLAVVKSNPFLKCIVYMEGIFSPRKNSSPSGKCSQCESSNNLYML